MAPAPYDYRTRPVDVGGFFDAIRQGRTDRLATEDEGRQNALAKYLPGALKGDAADRERALAASGPDQQIELFGAFSRLDDASKAREFQNLQKTASVLYGVKRSANPQAALEQAKPLLMQMGGIKPEDLETFDLDDIDGILASATSLADQIERDFKERQFGLQERQFGETVRSNRASEALAGQRLSRPSYNITAADKNAILDADQMVLANQSAIGLLQRARNISGAAYTGPLAASRGGVAAFFGSKGGEATLEFDNLLQQQVLPQLKAIFGGQPTEGERKIMLDLQGSSSLPVPVRNTIIDTAIELAGARLRFNEEKARDLRGGEYFRPGGNPGGSPGAAAPVTRRTATGPNGEKLILSEDGTRWVPLR